MSNSSDQKFELLLMKIENYRRVYPEKTEYILLSEEYKFIPQLRAKGYSIRESMERC